MLGHYQKRNTRQNRPTLPSWRLPCYRYGMICLRSSLIRQSCHFKSYFDRVLLQLVDILNTQFKQRGQLTFRQWNVWTVDKRVVQNLINYYWIFRMRCRLHDHLKKWIIKFKLLCLWFVGLGLFVCLLVLYGCHVTVIVASDYFYSRLLLTFIILYISFFFLLLQHICLLIMCLSEGCSLLSVPQCIDLLTLCCLVWIQSRADGRSQNRVRWRVWLKNRRNTRQCSSLINWTNSNGEFMFSFILVIEILSLCQHICIVYVTVKVWNQLFREITEICSHFMKSLFRSGTLWKVNKFPTHFH